MVTLSIEKEKKEDATIEDFLKSRAENPYSTILGDIQNLAELETKHKKDYANKN